MKMKVFVRKEGFDVATYLDQTKVRMRNFSAPLKRGGQIMLRSIDQNFKSAGRPKSWKPLSRRYFVRKIMDGYSTLPLTRTGALRRSVTYSVSADRLKIGTAIPYGRIHQYGGMAGRKHGARIPARPYLVFQTIDLERIEKMVLEYATGKRVR